MSTWYSVLGAWYLVLGTCGAGNGAGWRTAGTRMALRIFDGSSLLKPKTDCVGMEYGHETAN